MSNKISAWLSDPDYQIEIIQFAACIRIVIDDEKIVESKKAVLLCENNYPPIYYFPRDDVVMNYLHKINKVTFCPYKGEAEHWFLKLKNREIPIAAWSYRQPFEQVSTIKDYIAFYPEVMEHISL